MSQLSTQWQNLLSEVEIPSNKTLIEVNNKLDFFKIVDNVLMLPAYKHVTRDINLIYQAQDVLDAFLNAPNEFYDWDMNKVIQFKTKAHLAAVDNLLMHLKDVDVISVDCESRNTDLFDNEVLQLGIAYRVNGVEYCHILQGPFSLPTCVALEEVFTQPDITYVLQNGKFDKKMLFKYLGIDVRVDEDTMYMHYVGIDATRGTHGLKKLAAKYLNAPSWDQALDEFRKTYCRSHGLKVKEFTYDMFPNDVLAKYLVYDCIATLRLYYLFKKMMRPNSLQIYDKLIQAIPVFTEIETRGMHVDKAYIQQLESELKVELEEVLERIDTITAEHWSPEKYMGNTGAKSAPTKFNVGSAKQLQWMLYQVDNIVVRSTDAKTLQRCPDTEFVKAVKEFRKLSKRYNTYVIGMQGQVDVDNKVHCTFKLHGTVTGRLASADPNLHNIPREPRYKNMLTATPGNILLNADYKQAELCVLAVLSGDKWLQDVYRNRQDLHSRVAEEMFGKKFTSEDRVKAKTINFGIAYGISAKGLARDLKISQREAQLYINSWFDPMPRVKAFLDEWANKPKKRCACVTPFGREVTYIVTSKNAWHVRNEAMNFPIQSVASDLTLISLIAIHNHLKKKGMKSHIVNTVHDSIILDCDPDELSDVKRICERVMTGVPKKYLNTDVPFRVDFNTGFRWGEAK